MAQEPLRDDSVTSTKRLEAGDMDGQRGEGFA